MYEYGNTRLRAVKSRLLPQSEIEGFANASGVDELINLLLGTSYRRSMEEALSRNRGVRAVTRATHFEMTRLVNRMRDYYEGHAKEMIALMLQRFDVDNVKTVLRGLENRLPSEEITQAFTTFGNLDRKILMEIASADEPREAINLMASMQLNIAAPFVTYRVENPGAPLHELELALERWHVENIVEELRNAADDDKSLLHRLKLDVDLLNLMLVLRFARSTEERQALEEERDLQVPDLFWDHGNLSMAKLREAATEGSVEKVVDTFDSSLYADALTEGMEAYRTSGRLSDIERELRQYRLNWIRKQILADPLGISVPMGVLALKTVETSNIRWVAWGLQMGLPSDEIIEELEPM